MCEPGSVLAEASRTLLASKSSKNNKKRALGTSLESLLATFTGGGNDGDGIAPPSTSSTPSALLPDPRFAPLVRRARAQRAALFALSRGVPLTPSLMTEVDGVAASGGGGGGDGDGVGIAEPYFYSEPTGALRAAASRPPRSLPLPPPLPDVPEATAQPSLPPYRPALTADDVAAVRRLAADRERHRLRAAAAEASSSAGDRSLRALPAEARLALLLRARALRLAPLQQALRSAVLCDERRARAAALGGGGGYDESGDESGDEKRKPFGDPSSFLAEFSRWRIAAPWQLGSPEHVPKPPISSAELQEASAAQAKSEYKHLLRLGAQAARSMTQAERRAAAAAAAAAAALAKKQRQEENRRAVVASPAASAAGGKNGAPLSYFRQQQLAREAEAAAAAERERREEARLDRAVRILEAERRMLEQRATIAFEAAAVLRNQDPGVGAGGGERGGGAGAAAGAGASSSGLGFGGGLRARRNADDRRRAQRNTGARAWHGREQRRVAREGAARVAALKGADYGEYLRLARLAKDSRLNELLARTDAIVDALRARVPSQRAEAQEVAARKERARKADRKYKRERRRRLGIVPRKKKATAKEGGGGSGDDGNGASASESSSGGSSSDDGEGGGAADGGRADGDADGDADDGAFDWETAASAADDDEAADDAREEEGLDEDAKHLLRTQREYYRGVHAIRDRTISQPKLVTGGELRPYQVSGLRFMASLVNNRVNGILADEMGLGKTVQTISLVAHLLERDQLAGPHLILAPKAVLPNWAAEFERWAPGLTAVLYDGSPEQRRSIRDKWLQRPRSFHALLTHYDLAMRDSRALRSLPGGWGLLVVDEGHRLKNADARLATALRSLTAAHRILLTGTPLQNSLAELWALLNFVLPKVFDSAASFDEWFAAPLGDGGGGPGAAAPSMASAGSATPLTEEEQLLVITRLHQVLRPFVLRRTKAEVESDLPEKTSRVIRCGLSAWQASWYRQIARRGRDALGSGGSGGSGKGGSGVGGMMRGGLRNIAMQLRKVCVHPYLFLDNPNSSYSCGVDHVPEDPEEIVRASGKVALLDSVLEKLKATGHRVLLFSQMTRALDVLGDFLDLRGHKHLRLDGSTKTEDRARLLQEFNAPGSPHFVFLLSTRAGGLGLNLQSADTVIMFDSDWNPASDAQAEDRAHRIGQTKDVLVLVLCSLGTIEEVILDRAARKRELDAKVIQAGMFNDASTHRERTRALQALLAAGDPGGGGDCGSTTSATAINKALSRGPEELALFKQIDARRRAERGSRPTLMTEGEIPEFARSLLGGAVGADGREVDEEEEEPEVAAARRREELRKESAADAAAAAAGKRRSRRARAPGVSYREPGDDDFGFSSSGSELDDGQKEDDDDDAGSEIESLLDSEESDEEAELRAKAKAAARRAKKAEEKAKGGIGGGEGDERADGDDESDDDEEDPDVHAPKKRGRGRPPKGSPPSPAPAAPNAATSKARNPAPASAPRRSGRGGGGSGLARSDGGGGPSEAAATTATTKRTRGATTRGVASSPAPPDTAPEQPPSKRGRGRPPSSNKRK